LKVSIANTIRLVHTRAFAIGDLPDSNNGARMSELMCAFRSCQVGYLTKLGSLWQTPRFRKTGLMLGSRVVASPPFSTSASIGTSTAVLHYSTFRDFSCCIFTRRAVSGFLQEDLDLIVPTFDAPCLPLIRISKIVSLLNLISYRTESLYTPFEQSRSTAIMREFLFAFLTSPGATNK
jgi:hypothetical protein